MIFDILYADTLTPTSSFSWSHTWKSRGIPRKLFHGARHCASTWPSVVQRSDSRALRNCGCFPTRPFATSYSAIWHESASRGLKPRGEGFANLDTIRRYGSGQTIIASGALLLVPGDDNLSGQPRAAQLYIVADDIIRNDSTLPRLFNQFFRKLLLS